MVRMSAVAVLSLGLSALPAFADDGADRVPEAAATTVASPAAGAVPAGEGLGSMKPIHLTADAAKRPAALTGLYVGLAGLQVYDAVSTMRGLSLGAREANPIMQGAVHNSAMFWSIKAAATAVPMVLAEKMWKKNRVGAVVMMAVANSVAAVVASNNARVLRGGR